MDQLSIGVGIGVLMGACLTALFFFWSMDRRPPWKIDTGELRHARLDKGECNCELVPVRRPSRRRNFTQEFVRIAMDGRELEAKEVLARFGFSPETGIIDIEIVKKGYLERIPRVGPDLWRAT